MIIILLVCLIINGNITSSLDSYLLYFLNVLSPARHHRLTSSLERKVGR